MANVNSKDLATVVDRLFTTMYPKIPRSYALQVAKGVLKRFSLADIPQDLGMVYTKAVCLLSPEKTEKGVIKDLVDSLYDVLGGVSPKMAVVRRKKPHVAELSDYIDVVTSRLGQRAVLHHTLTRMLYAYYDGRLPSVGEFEGLFFDNLDPMAGFSQFSALAIKMAPKKLKNIEDFEFQRDSHALAWYRAECKRIHKKDTKGIFDVLDEFVLKYAPAALPLPGSFVSMVTLEQAHDLSKAAEHIALRHIHDYTLAVSHLTKKACRPVIDAVAEVVGALNLPSPQKMADIINSCGTSNVYGRLSDVIIAVICGGDLESIRRASDEYAEDADVLSGAGVFEIVKDVGLDKLPPIDGWLRVAINHINESYCGLESYTPSKILAKRLIKLIKDGQVPPFKDAEVEVSKEPNWARKYLDALAVTGEHYSVAKAIADTFVERAKSCPDLKEMPTPAQFKEAVAKARALHPTWEGAELSGSVLFQFVTPPNNVREQLATTKARLEHGYPLIFVNTTESSVEVYCQTLAVGGVAITSPKYLLPKSVASDAAVDAAIDQAVSDTVAAVNAHEKKGGTNG